MSMVAERRKAKTTKFRNGYHLPADKLEEARAAFGIHPDMGPRRSLVALEGELRRNHPEIAVSRQSLEKWSKLHDWVKRVRAHDKSVAAAPPPQAELIVDPDFDQIDALLQAANQALTRAMNAAPVVSKPSDVKALVDAAANALKLVETIKNQSRGKVSREEIAADMARILAKVREARFRDVEIEVEKRLNERLKSLGIVPGVAVDAVPVKPSLNVNPMAIEADEVEIGSRSRQR